MTGLTSSVCKVGTNALTNLLLQFSFHRIFKSLKKFRFRNEFLKRVKIPVVSVCVLNVYDVVNFH